MKAPTISELRNGPPMVDLLTAAAAIGISRTRAYELARQGKFPVALRRVGTTYRVPVSGLLRYLHAAEAND
jgi:Helix-turn-helix domain